MFCIFNSVLNGPTWYLHITWYSVFFCGDSVAPVEGSSNMLLKLFRSPFFAICGPPHVAVQLKPQPYSNAPWATMTPFIFVMV